jgi:hypothetical protein
MSFFATNRRFGLTDVALYVVGVVGLAMCLTLIFLSMRAVMDVGGFCAEGGPYVIETHCPEGVPLLLVGGIFGLFGFGGLMIWKGVLLGGPYAGLVGLAWPVLFLSLGWNFLEYGLFNPPEGEGIIWGWLIPGVPFVIMGIAPLLAVLPIGHSGRAGSARASMAGRIAPRSPAPSSMTFDRSAVAAAAAEEGVDSDDLVTKLERLAALRQSGDLTSDEFDQAKRALIAQAGG